MLAVAAGAHMRGDPLALEEDFDRPDSQPHLDFGADETVGGAVIVGGGLDVIINADTAARHSQNSYGSTGKVLSAGRSTPPAIAGASRQAGGSAVVR